MDFLINLMHGLHVTFGIRKPRQDQAKIVVLAWILIILAMIAGFIALLYLLSQNHA